jgi:hypothetical protein
MRGRAATLAILLDECPQFPPMTASIVREALEKFVAAGCAPTTGRPPQAARTPLTSIQAHH